MTFRLLFADSYTGDVPADLSLEFATPDEARDYANRDWANSSEAMGTVAPLIWAEYFGTATYRVAPMPGAPEFEFVVRYVIYTA